MRLLVFLIACHGLVQIVTGGKIFHGLREWLARRSAFLGYWIKCPMCFGVPAGAGLAAAGLWQPVTGSWPLDVFAAAMTGSAICWTMHVVLHKLGADEL